MNRIKKKKIDIPNEFFQSLRQFKQKKQKIKKEKNQFELLIRTVLRVNSSLRRKYQFENISDLNPGITEKVDLSSSHLHFFLLSFPVSTENP